MPEGKNVVVGVCGSIAAYKVVEVVGRLIKLNFNVHVVMTDNACRFVAPLTFQTISRNPVATGMFNTPEKWDIQHVSIAEKADIILVAPSTANIIGKIASGIADDILTTTIMASKAPVLFAPAMNTVMYENPVVQGNISKLKDLGYRFIEPGTGLMACGTVGKGRLPEPGVIVENILKILEETSKEPDKEPDKELSKEPDKEPDKEPFQIPLEIPGEKDFAGLRVLVTAGPTMEPIDPVRFMSNHSSGKMGYAIASAAVERGAQVKLVSGPVNLKAPGGVEIVNVTTAGEMYRKVMEYYKDSDIIFMIAAVADYRCENVTGSKIKKTAGGMSLKLVQNPDIAKELGKVKGKRIVVGACAETEDLVENARKKLVAKNFDIIMANNISLEGAGFGSDTNIVSIVGKDGNVRELPMMKKTGLAHILLDEVLKQLN